ncbi:MAG: haloacid dehalogenase type II [Burkholderiales bacterium]|nr:haloacid dehalogenase type II [Burkholderiales bacterium]
MSDFDPRDIRALVFDVFGTVVDWRSSIVREGQALSAAKGLSVDWAAFADAWRAGYRPAMARATAGAAAGEGGWANIDALHREILHALLPRFGLAGLSDAERAQLNLVWHRLDPWPDSVAGLQRLKSRFAISTLSNGNIALLVDMARHAGLPWDCVLSAEIVRRYKPDPEVYRMAARLLGVAPGQLLMVAAHPSDLRGAQRAGLRTAYVPRPLEHGANPHGAAPADALADDRFDVVADDFVDLARRLGA